MLHVRDFVCACSWLLEYKACASGSGGEDGDSGREIRTESDVGTRVNRWLHSSLSAFVLAHANSAAIDLESSSSSSTIVAATTALGNDTTKASALLARDVRALAAALPLLSAALITGGDALVAAAAWATLRSAATSAADASWARLRAPGGWPSVAWREAFVMAASLSRGASDLIANGDAASAMRAIDLGDSGYYHTRAL